MQIKLPLNRDYLFAIFLLATLTFVGGCSSKSNSCCYASPEEVMAAEQAAYKNGDWSTYVDCFTSESHEKAIRFVLPFLLAGPRPPTEIEIGEKDKKQAIAGKGKITTPFSLASGTAAEKAETQEQYEKFLRMCAKHGLADLKKREGEVTPKYGERLAAQIADKRGFLVELWTFGPLSDRDNAFRNNLTDVKITGDRATGAFGRSLGKGRCWETVEFKKVAGSWRIENPGVTH